MSRLAISALTSAIFALIDMLREWEFRFYYYNPALRAQVIGQGGLDRNAWFNRWCSAPIKIPAKNKNKMEVKYE
ncbi:MAG: hypothetical protein ABIK31_03345 [candidate division WOR-3 bacterium]